MMTAICRSNTTTTAGNRTTKEEGSIRQRRKTKVPNINPLQVLQAYLPQSLHELRPLLIVQRLQLLALLLLLFPLQDRLDLGGLLAQL